MELTKEKYDEIIKLLKSQEEDIKMLKSKLESNASEIEDYKNIFLIIFSAMKLDIANVTAAILAILETAGKNKSLDITDIKQNFIFNMKESSDSLLEFTDEDEINKIMEQIVSFIELLEEKQKLSDKIKVKNVKTSGNITKKIMNKDYENMKNNNSEKSAETENIITTEADDKDTKHSNVIHINFKGDKD